MADPSEVVTVVDTNDNVIGTKKFSELTNNDRWRVVQIWVESFDGHVLIAKRASQKKLEPNLWELGASGTVTHPDGYEISAKRELEEELGIKTDGFKLETVRFYKKPFGSRACGMFRVKVDKNIQLEIQPEEVAQVRWVDIEALKEQYSANKMKYTSEVGGFLEYYAS